MTERLYREEGQVSPMPPDAAEKPKKAAKTKTDKTAAPTAEAPAAPAEAPEPVKRAPIDPRYKVMKKFYGKFLPKGVLRERFKSIKERWDSNDEHGGVTVDELKTLLSDWKGTREKPPRMPKA